MDVSYLPMKLWAKEELPREKMLQHGVSSLTLNELFAILLRSGVGGESALDLARRMLADHHHDLNQLARCSVRELMNRYKGIGVAKATAIVAAIEIGRRRKPSDSSLRPTIRWSQDAYLYLKSFLADLDHEEFWAIYLNHGNRIIGSECLFTGGMDKSVIDVRMLFRNALEMKAAQLIVAHNHPSGVLRPSPQDEAITKKIANAGHLLDIRLLDHLIVSVLGYYSFADEGGLSLS
jgi:DNA repair protein RadC